MIVFLLYSITNIFNSEFQINNSKHFLSSYLNQSSWQIRKAWLVLYEDEHRLARRGLPVFVWYRINQRHWGILVGTVSSWSLTGTQGGPTFWISLTKENGKVILSTLLQGLITNMSKLCVTHRHFRITPLDVRHLNPLSFTKHL